MRRAAALILGGGPAGSAAAIALARGGIRPLVLERTAAPADALCGGFLSWRSLDALAALGIDPDTLNPARVTRLRLFARGRHTDSGLPRPAIGVSRRRLDALLLDRATQAGAAVERGVTVRAFEDGRARLADGSAVAAAATLLATGKHDLRGVARPQPAADPAIGLRLRLAPSSGLARLVGGAIELHLVDRGYAGLVLQEDGSANLCLAVRRSRLDAAGTPAALIAAIGREAPALGERLAHAAGAPPIDAVANVPYGWRARETGPALYRLGDQAGVIPSLAGEGMGIALASGVSAARAIAAGIDAPAWQRGFDARIAAPIALADRLRAAAERPWSAALLVGAAGVPGAARLAAWLTRIKQDGVDEGAR